MDKIFSLREGVDPVQQPMLARFAPVLDRLLALDHLDRLYGEAANSNPDQSFVDRALAVLKVSYNLADADAGRIPRSGPVVVVANHSFGGIEGLLLASVLSSVRADVKLMANYLLQRIPDMRDLCIFVDPFGAPRSPHTNSRPLRESIRWLKSGGTLGVFPSGEVAHFEWRAGGIEEPAWSTTVARIVRATGASVLPVYFEGTNSFIFHALGAVHPRLRTALLPRQLYNKRNRRFTLRVGSAIPFARLEQCGGDEEIMAYLRSRTYNLRHRSPAHDASPHPGLRTPWSAAKLPAAIIAPVPREDQAVELAALPGEQRLVASGEFEVWFARSAQIPCVLREIGRLREETFRTVGEGSGRALDLDSFDDAYIHLFLWNAGRRELVGAYRLGPTDEILPKSGPRGLYTCGLFKIHRDLLNRLTPALEMGRSFIRREYQRNATSLYLIWKGIAEFVMRHPRYKVLFGPVSISGTYQTISMELLVAFLKMNNYMPDLARKARPRKPFRTGHIPLAGVGGIGRLVTNIEDVEDLIADVETVPRGVPILLKQYLKLGGKILGFNIDPKFGHCLDSLMLVDLTAANRRVLQRYMGAEGMRKFLAHHGIQE